MSSDRKESQFTPPALFPELESKTWKHLLDVYNEKGFEKSFDAFKKAIEKEHPGSGKAQNVDNITDKQYKEKLDSMAPSASHRFQR